MTIWKFPLKRTDFQNIEMPEGAVILCAMIQHGELCLWAEVHPENKTKPCPIRVVGTGHPISGRDIYISSVIDGPFVWHVYLEQR